MSNLPNNPQSNVQNLQPFTKFCVTIGAIPASYSQSLTFEEQILWLCDFLQNTVIPTINNNAEAVRELQNLYIELKNYVDNYFNNLDVQGEINNKLDSMAQDGSLYSLMAPYFSSINAQINSLNSKIDENTARINNLSTTTDSATNENAELIDIRTAANGTIYTSAGNSVRGQITDCNNLIEGIENLSLNSNSYDDTTINIVNPLSNTNLSLINHVFKNSLISTVKLKTSGISKVKAILYELYDDNSIVPVASLENLISEDTTNYHVFNFNKFVKNGMIGFIVTSSSLKASFGNYKTFSMLQIPYIDGTMNLSNATNFTQFSICSSVEWFTSSIITKSFLIVDKNGNGDFSSITEAINNNPNNLPIFIKNGVYEEEIKCDDKIVTLIGEDKRRTIVKANNGLYGHDCIYLSRGYISNITFYNKYENGTSQEVINQNGAYAVHLDSTKSNNSDGCTFENCILISDFAPALGCGLKPHSTFEFINCDFISNQENRGNYLDVGTLGALYVHNDHNNEEDYQGQKLIVKNSTIKSIAKNAICISKVTLSDSNNTNAVLEFINNVFASDTSPINSNEMIYYRGLLNITNDNYFKKSKLCYGNNLSDLNN